jgi:iron complex outermembrane receptor protein
LPLSLALLLSAALLSPSLTALAQDIEVPEEIEAEQAIEAPADVELPEVESVVPEGIEAISVTGEQLDVTDVQDEAQAISAFSMDDLDRMNITNVDGLALNVPGLHVGQQGQNAIVTLRGVGTENASLTGEPAVAFHVDGINYGRPAAARVAFFDLQSIEVNRGPQGLKGGKNSTSGSINVFTNDPSDEYEIDGDVLFGNYDRVRVRGTVNVPVTEFLSTRFAMFYEDRDGFLDNVFVSDSRDPFDVDSFGLRAKLRFMPTDSVDIVLGYNYYKQTGNGPQADIVPVPNGAPCNAGGVIPPGVTTVMPLVSACRVVGGYFIPGSGFPPDREPFRYEPGLEDPDPREIYTDQLSSQDDRYWGFSGKLDWQVPEIPLLGATDLKLLGGYQRTETLFIWDFDSTSLDLFNVTVPQEVDEYSSELQWSGSGGERLRWQATLFFMRQKGEGNTTQEPAPRDPDNNPFTPMPREIPLEIIQEVENKSYGAALHGEYYLSESLTFSLGGRWIKDRKKTFLQRRSGASFQACVGLNNIRRPSPFEDPDLPECEITDRGTMWGSRLEWRPPTQDQLLFYAGIDRGFKSGGFASGGVGNYKPEQIWAYTLGAKSEFFDSRLQLNVEGFFYAYEDMQLALIDGTKIRTENSDTRMYGWDVEATATPIPGLNLRAVINFIKTETLDYYSLDPATLGVDFDNKRLTEREREEANGRPFPGTAECAPEDDLTIRVPCAEVGDRLGLDDYSGNDLSRSPKWKMTFSAEYEIPLGNYGTLTPRGQYTWVDDTYFRVFNRDFDLQDDYHKTDLKLTWRSPEERFTVEAFVDNVEDDAVVQNILVGSRTFGAPPLAWYGEPRFYGVRLGFRY